VACLQARRCPQRHKGATVFAYRVSESGTLWRGRLRCLRQAPDLDRGESRNGPKSRTTPSQGLYFYDNEVVWKLLQVHQALAVRGELEITDVNTGLILQRGALDLRDHGAPDMAWLDAGTPESLLDASQFIQAIEKRQGQRIACLEEIAVRKGYIPVARLAELAEPIANSDYGKYLLRVHADMTSPHSGGA
jgi:glucose-1-phosphate thymidylyltransferase